ncbi:Deuterolysin metalloprotease family-domain-containing protein [Annulohypoxylon maeteangense]|uniref:Deuterolysin metalloprotease family-domain-containing protein n=1 Tax=Annulohypoxylon maeteangense TaxID=1927788 RepID=UPI0020080145|nr:Deuterolysin metalloprotease family-domain-containing protein [Annulohypoxylon maeteangense]KAI0886669.1 Deuterolysin metalloprotease family-domain-containing protein [Annulohypoxylon maeteangense]
MKFTAGVSLFAAVASAISVDLTKRDTPLDVKLEMVGNTAVKASITNTGASDLKIFKTGTFLDENAPTEKVAVYQGGNKVQFDGVKLRVMTTGLGEEAFQTIAAGETVEATFDVGQVYDLSAGGNYDVVSLGAMSFAEANTTEISGVVPVSGSTVSAQIDGAAAKEVRRRFHAKRIDVQSDCTGTKLSQTNTAISNCRALASAAATAASSGSATKVTEYFKSSTSSVRSTVASVFQRVASECGSTSSGVSDLYCSDVYGACSSGVLAYTLPSQSYMVNCNLYYTALSPITSTCHGQDQATTTLHESTHLTQIKGTDDYGTYGYSGVRGLSASQNLNHADTYALFANAIYVGC